jgi:hypothetical protein
VHYCVYCVGTDVLLAQQGGERVPQILGPMSLGDIRGIADVCHPYDVPLIVDEAWVLICARLSRGRRNWRPSG